MTVAQSDNNIKWIKQNVFNEYGKLNPQSANETWWIKKNVLNIWNDLLLSTSFLNNPTYVERIFCYCNQTEVIPTCKICDNTVKFSRINKVYNQFCSNKCIGKDKQVQIKKNKTAMSKYGEVKNLSSANHKKQMQKTVQTKYNVDNYAKSKEFVIKSQLTQKEKYGKLFVNSTEYIQKKNQTCLKKYNDTTWMRLPTYKTVTGNINKKITPTVMKEIVTRYKAGEAKQYIAQDLGFSYSHMNKLIGSAGLDTCLPQNKINYDNNFVSAGELQLRNLLPSGPDYEYNNRKLLWPYELDIVDHTNKIAYEFNGTYWHSDFFKNRLYHVKKLTQVESLGYKLFTIFENTFNDKQEILLRKLKSQLPQPILFARNMYIVECEYPIVEKFLNENHIQGSRTSRINYAIYNNDLLVAVASFNTYKDGVELIRFASTVRIPGILSRILKRIDSDIIYSFANRCYTFRPSNLYVHTKFSEIKLTDPNYFYVKGKQTITRNSAMKHKLATLLKEFDDNKSEYENMILHGYHRVWDCGNILYKLVK